MNPDDKEQKSKEQLRSEAEAQLARRMPELPASANDTKALLLELQVHQIELEMQNQALREAQSDLEESRDRYADLYEFAPVGYLTLNADGLIAEINLTAVKLLGVERTKLLQRRFAAFVVPEDLDRWTQFFLSMKRPDRMGSTELALTSGDGTVLQALLDCKRRPSTGVGADDMAIRIALTDISRRKAAEAVQVQQGDELTRFNRTMVGREMAMIELKRQVNALSRELGQAPPFNLDFADAPDAGALP